MPERDITMQYTQAKFWKCALQVNPAGYIKHRGQEQVLSESEYNQKLLDVCVKENIKVLGIDTYGSVFKKYKVIMISFVERNIFLIKSSHNKSIKSL